MNVTESFFVLLFDWGISDHLAIPAWPHQRRSTYGIGLELTDFGS